LIHPVGENGLADVVETFPDSGVVRYTLADSDDNLYGHGPVEYDFAELVSDRELFNGLYWSRDNQNDWYDSATELHQSAAAVYGLLDEYLATHHGS